jgi:hypothetical protein
MDGIGGTEMSTPYVEKGWRVQATEQLDWSNPEDFDAYMKELSKPQEEISKLAKGIALTNPLWGPAMVAGQAMERKATVNKIKAMENIANLIGDSVSAASAVKAGESYKAGLTESQRKYADTQNGEGYTITLVNQIMGRGFLDDIEGTRGNGFHSVADLQNMPQWKKDELKAAIDANNQELQAKSATKERRLKITTDAEAKRQAVAAEARKKEAETLAKLKAQKDAGNVPTEAEIRKARDRGQTTTGQTLSKTQSQKSKSEKMADYTKSQKTIEARTKSGQFDSRGLARGGRAKGGLIKKPNKK